MEFSKKIWVGYLEYEPDSIASMGALSLPKLWMWSAELTSKGEIKQLRMEATEGEKMEEWGGHAVLLHFLQLFAVKGGGKAREAGMGMAEEGRGPFAELRMCKACNIREVLS